MVVDMPLDLNVVGVTDVARRPNKVAKYLTLVSRRIVERVSEVAPLAHRNRSWVFQIVVT